MSEPRYCLMRAPLGAYYTAHAKFVDRETADGSTVISRHETSADASRESMRLQLESSRLVREDAAALDGKRLLASIIGVTVNFEEEARRCQLHLVTPSGGTLIQYVKLSESRVLEAAVRQAIKLDQRGTWMLPTPIPVTLRLVEDIVRRDAQVADWHVVDVRQSVCLMPDQLRQRDVLVIDHTHWLVRDFTADEVIVTRFMGGWRTPRPNEHTIELTLDAGTLYTVERLLGQPPIRTQMPTAQLAKVNQTATPLETEALR